MSRRGKPTLDEMIAEENARLAKEHKAFQSWRESVMFAADAYEVPEDAWRWLWDRERDPDRAVLVMLAWEMNQRFMRWPAEQREAA